MKTAQEWMKEGMRGDYKEVAFEDRIKMVQADALRHAAEILNNGRSERTPQSIRSAWANVINAEADKLETKWPLV